MAIQEPERAMVDPAVRRVAWGLGVLVFVAVVATGGQYGMCWDEGLYWPAYRDVAAWAGAVLTRPGWAFSHEGIVAGWESVHEFPPLVKWLGAACVAVAPERFALFALRLVPAALFAATVAMLFLLACRRVAPMGALLVALAYAGHPRLFGHAHFAVSETPMAFLTVLTIWVASGDLSRWRSRVALAVVAGLAVATKVNGLILVTALVMWLAARPWLDRAAGHCWRRDLATAGLVLAVAPIVAWAIWPWMWHDTGARLHEYWLFIREHRHYGVWYLGEKWVLPPGNERLVPWHYPLVMTAVASPVAWLALVGAGLAAVGRAALRARRIESPDLLLLLLAAGPFAALMLPTSPKYDGLRLFLPAFAPLTLLGARAAEWLPRDLSAGLVRGGRLTRRGWALAAVAGLLGAGVGAGARDGLGFYNVPTRVLTARASAFPFETTYWTESATPRVFDDIVAYFGTDDVHIKTLALDAVVFGIQRDRGALPAGLRFNGEPPYDAHLMQNRKGFWSRTEWWFATEREPLLTWPEGAREPRLMLYDGRPPGVK